MYNLIFEPKLNKFIKLKSRKGIHLLKKYIFLLKGGMKLSPDLEYAVNEGSITREKAESFMSSQNSKVELGHFQKKTKDKSSRVPVAGAASVGATTGTILATTVLAAAPVSPIAIFTAGTIMAGSSLLNAVSNNSLNIKKKEDICRSMNCFNSIRGVWRVAGKGFRKWFTAKGSDLNMKGYCTKCIEQNQAQYDLHLNIFDRQKRL